MSYYGYDEDGSSSAQPIGIANGQDSYEDYSNSLGDSHYSFQDSNYPFQQPAHEPMHYPQTYGHSGWGGENNPDSSFFDLRHEPNDSAYDQLSMSLPSRFDSGLDGGSDFDWTRQGQDFEQERQAEDTGRNIFHQSPLMVGSAHVDSPDDPFALNDVNERFSQSQLDDQADRSREDNGYSTPVGAAGYMELPEMEGLQQDEGIGHQSPLDLRETDNEYLHPHTGETPERGERALVVYQDDDRGPSTPRQTSPIGLAQDVPDDDGIDGGRNKFMNDFDAFSPPGAIPLNMKTSEDALNDPIFMSLPPSFNDFSPDQSLPRSLPRSSWGDKSEYDAHQPQSFADVHRDDDPDLDRHRRAELDGGYFDAPQEDIQAGPAFVHEDHPWMKPAPRRKSSGGSSVRFDDNNQYKPDEFEEQPRRRHSSQLDSIADLPQQSYEPPLPASLPVSMPQYQMPYYPQTSQPLQSSLQMQSSSDMAQATHALQQQDIAEQERNRQYVARQQHQAADQMQRMQQHQMQDAQRQHQYDIQQQYQQQNYAQRAAQQAQQQVSEMARQQQHADTVAQRQAQQFAQTAAQQQAALQPRMSQPIHTAAFRPGGGVLGQGIPGLGMPAFPGMPIGLGMQPIMPGVGYQPLGHGISSLANTLDNQNNTFRDYQTSNIKDRAVANVEGLRGSALNKIDGLVGMNSMNLANPMLGNPALEMMHQPMLTSRTMGGRPMPVNGRMI